MPKRLQILLPDHDMDEIRRLARREHITVAEWVRRALREACSRAVPSDPEARLSVVRRAAQLSNPKADIGQILREMKREPEK